MKTLFAVVCFLLVSAVQAEVPSYLVYCDEDEFQYMNDHWQEEIEIDCIVVIPDTIYTGCRMRIRGDSSRWFRKKSYRITFSLADPLDDRVEWNFNADYLDESYMHTWLFSWILRELEYPCFDVNHVRLYVNDEYRGLYMRCEPIDQQMLLENGIDPNGNLYKAALDGACLSIWDDVEAFWDKKTNQGQGNYDLYQLISDLESMPIDSILPVIGELFDLNDLLTISALNYLTCNTSTYYHNYFLYHDIWYTGKWTMLPWDVDKTFMHVGWTYYSANNPHWYDNPLQRKLFQDPLYLDLLFQRMESIGGTVFNSAMITPLIDSLQIELAAAVDEDVLDLTDLAGFIAGSDSIKYWFVPGRLAHLQGQYETICRPYSAHRGDSVGVEGISVSWERAFDPDGDPITYNVMVTTDIWEPDSIIVIYSDIPDTVFIIEGLEPGDYIWRVWVEQIWHTIEAYDRYNVFQIKEGSILQGTLEGNTVLTYADSPYLVVGDIEIPQGSNLSVESGVQVRFSAGTALTCHGTLTTSGIVQDSVLFCADIGSEPWKGILVDGEGGAYLEYTVVSGTDGYGPGDHFAALVVEDTDLQMEHCSFRDNVACVKVNRGAVLIAECDFAGGNAGELFFMKAGTGALVRDSRFGNLHDPPSGSCDGIEFQDCIDGTFTIQRCEVFDIEGDCIDYNSSFVTSFDNIVHGATDKGFSIGESGGGGPTHSYAYLDREIIYDCPIGIGVKDGSTAEVDGCTIVSCAIGISLYEKTPGLGGGICHAVSTILYANASTYEIDPLSSFDIAYSISDDPDPLPGTGNIAGDPEFIDYEDRNFRLRFTSPCIDTGDPGESDPDGTRQDMGAIFFPQAFDQLCINELMSSNQTTIADEWGEYGDWFELYNGADWDADLSWVYMSDDPLHPDMWRFPAGTILPSGGYLIVWADGEYWKPGLHLPWRLAASGDSLYMSVAEVRGRRTVVSRIDEVIFGSIGQDISYGRTPDGGSLWENQEFPTPGSSNGGPGPFPGTLLVGNPFPNPCRGIDLALDFEIDQGWTTVSVYDLTGRLLSVLDDRLMPEGPHRIYWNLEGITGVPVPSGVYLILVEHAGAIPVARKVVVLSR